MTMATGTGTTTTNNNNNNNGATTNTTTTNTTNTTNTTRRSTPTMMGAIGRALLAWIVFYIGLAHFFVYFNWDATSEGGLSSSSSSSSPLIVVVPEDHTTTTTTRSSTLDGIKNTTILDDNDNNNGIVTIEVDGPQDSEDATTTTTTTTTTTNKTIDISLIPDWVLEMNNEELLLLMTEEPLEEIPLLNIFEDPIPIAIQPLDDTRSQWKESIAQIQIDIEQYQTMWKQLQEQKQTLTSVIQDMEQSIQKLEQLLQNVTQEEEEQEEEKEDDEEDTIWTLIRSQTQKQQQEHEYNNHLPTLILDDDMDDNDEEDDDDVSSDTQQQQQQKQGVAADVLSWYLMELTDLTIQFNTVEDVQQHFTRMIQVLEEHIQEMTTTTTTMTTTTTTTNDTDNDEYDERRHGRNQLLAWRELNRVLRRKDYPTQSTSSIFPCPNVVENDDDDDDEEKENVSPQVVDHDRHHDDTTTTTTTTTTISKLSNHGPTEDDAQTIIQELWKIWDNMVVQQQQQDKGHVLPVISQESYQRLVTFRDQLVQDWIQQAEQQVVKDAWTQRRALEEQQKQKEQEQQSASMDCLEREEVESLVQAGLLALERRQDLNHAILTTMTEQGIDTRSIILDAILEDDKNDNNDNNHHHHRKKEMANQQPHLQKVTTTTTTTTTMQSNDDEGDNNNNNNKNDMIVMAIWDPNLDFTWRQILDRPWTKTVATKFIPWLIDMIGGYNDWLDQWLDEQFPPSSSSSQNNQNNNNEANVLWNAFLETIGSHSLPRPILESWLLSMTQQQ